MCFAQGLGPVGDARCICLMSLTVKLGKQRGSGQLCVLSSGHHPSGDSTDDHPQVQNHPDWVARDVLVLGSGESVHKTSSKTSLVGESDSTIQQQTSQQDSLLEFSCLASGVRHEY